MSSNEWIVNLKPGKEVLRMADLKIEIGAKDRVSEKITDVEKILKSFPGSY